MRVLLSVILVFISTLAFSQIHFPKSFKLIKGDNGTGVDDIYSDGKYAFDTHNVFGDFDFNKNNDSSIKYISDFSSFHFILQRIVYFGVPALDLAIIHM